MRRHLSETAGDWLLIFDDANDLSISFSKYFPIRRNGTILITTRNKELRLLATGVGSSHLDRMEHKNAIALFSAVGGPIDSDPVARSNATSIVELLGGTPLALTQAGRFMKRSDCTKGQYLKMLEDQRELQPRRSWDTHICATTYFTPLEISFQHIEEMSSEVARDALELVYFFSFITTESVYAEELFARAWHNNMELQRCSIVAKYQLRVLCNPANVDWQPSRLRKALEFLVSFALIRQDREGNEINFHLRVLECAYNRPSKADLLEYSRVTVHTLASAAGTNLENTRHHFREALLSNITFFLRRHNKDFVKDNGVRHLAGILSSFSPVFRDSGQYEKALELDTGAMHLRLRLLGAEHSDTLSSMKRIGRHLRDLKRPHEALQVDSEALDSWRRILGVEALGSEKWIKSLAQWRTKHIDSHRAGLFLDWKHLELRLGFHDTVELLECLANDYEMLDEHQEARSLLETVLEVKLEVSGNNTDRTTTTMSHLDCVYRRLGRYTEALKLEEEVLLQRRRTFGQEHRFTINSLKNLAIIYGELGREQKAAELLQKALEISLEVMGDKHPDSITSMHNLAVSYSKLERHDEVADLETRVLEFRKESLGVQNQDTLQAMADLARAYESLNRHSEALELRLKVVEHREGILGPLDPTTWRAMADLATSFEKTKSYGKAKDLRRSLLRYSETQFGRGHSATSKGMADLEIPYTNHTGQLQQGAETKTFLQKRKITVHENCSPNTLRFAITLGNVDAIRGIIERHFDAVAADDFEWLQELKSLGYGNRDIAELLLDDMNKSPWIYFSQPTPQDTAILPEFHVSNCIHEGGKKADLAPKLIVEPLENNEDMKRLIAEHCGLAGVVPKSRDNINWTGVVAFSGQNQDTASISYNIPGSRYQLISRACEALRRFCGIASYLQKKRLCCNSFTVLRYTSVDGFMAIELRHVGFRLASDLFKVLQLVLNNFESPGLISQCLPQLTRLANDVIRVVSNDHAFANADVLDFEDCLDIVSLAAQILTLGLYLYSQAHTGSVHSFCLMDPLLHIYLFGIQSLVQDSNRAHVQVSLSSLTCMAGVTGDRVTVFGSYHYSESRSSDKIYDLLASPEGLADI